MEEMTRQMMEEMFLYREMSLQIMVSHWMVGGQVLLQMMGTDFFLQKKG